MISMNPSPKFYTSLLFKHSSDSHKQQGFAHRQVNWLADSGANLNKLLGGQGKPHPT